MNKAMEALNKWEKNNPDIANRPGHSEHLEYLSVLFLSEILQEQRKENKVCPICRQKTCDCALKEANNIPIVTRNQG